MTASVAERFRLLKRDLEEFGGEEEREAGSVLDALAHHVPLVGAMTTRNFDDVAELLRGGQALAPTDEERKRVIQRALDQAAPFHRPKNSVADALLIELYATSTQSADLSTDPHAFVTSNHEDFSAPRADRRQPHPDLAPLFAAADSTYGLGVEGLVTILEDHFGDRFREIVEESDFEEEPRRLDEILEAEQEFFDRVWYERSISHEWRYSDGDHEQALEDLRRIAGPARRRIEEKSGGAQNLGPYSDFEWGMVNGKLSALRWVLGSEWDFLDT